MKKVTRKWLGETGYFHAVANKWTDKDGRNGKSLYVKIHDSNETVTFWASEEDDDGFGENEYETMRSLVNYLSRVLDEYDRM